MSLWEGSEHKMGRKKYVMFTFKIKIQKYNKLQEMWASFSRDHEHPMNAIICFNRNCIHNFK